MKMKLKLEKEDWEYFLEHAFYDWMYAPGEESKKFEKIHQNLMEQIKMLISRDIDDLDDMDPIVNPDPAQINLFEKEE